MQSFQTYQANPAVESGAPFFGGTTGPRKNIAHAEKFASMLLTARSQLLHRATKEVQDFTGFKQVLSSSELNMQKKNDEYSAYAANKKEEEKKHVEAEEAKREEHRALLIELDMVSGEQQLARQQSLESHKQGVINGAGGSATARSSRLASHLAQAVGAEKSTLHTQQSLNASQQQAAERLSQVSDTNASIEVNLNALNKANLASPGDGPVPEYSQTLAAMDAHDLRANLDSLAKQANVSRLSLQMSNPQTMAAQRRDAAAISQLPTSEQAQAQVARQSHLGNAFKTQEQFRAQLEQKLSHAMTPVSDTSLAGAAQALTAVAAQVASGEIVQGASVQTMVGHTNAVLQTQALSHEAQVAQALSSLQQGAQGALNVLKTSAGAFEENLGLSAAALSTLSQKDRQQILGEDKSSSVIGQGFASSQVSEPQPQMKTAASAHMHMGQNNDENAAALHEKVMQMAAKNMKHLTVDLSPSDYGRMRISIDLSHDNEALSVALSAANEQTRDVLEQALPKLREILAQQHVETEAVIAEYEDAERTDADGQSGQQQQQSAEQKEQEDAELKSVLFGEKASGTLLAKGITSGTAADNLTGLQQRFSSYGRTGQALRI